ncbi:galactose mutarotase [Ruminococcaceae bacterium OttesenSCG-928-L11]|nr:galactose mutarotase [Ruminococcaceae bacterium OttesenSCG-928-L11]
MAISAKQWGKRSTGEEVTLYTLINQNGVEVQITDCGASIVSLRVPDRNGVFADVILGYGDVSGYETNKSFFGAFVGRNANRIKQARVVLGGKTWELERNNGENNLHSGKGGMTYRMFEGTIAGETLELRCKVPHLGDGFPGNLDCCVTYSLSEDNALTISYKGVSDHDTVINMTNHSHFNLAGHNSGSIDTQVLQMDAPFFTPNGSDCMPTGEILSVAGTPFDFTEGRTFGEDINGSFEQIALFGGYDHNLVLAGEGLRRFATATDPDSGRVMEAWTDLPAVQLYTCNGMNVEEGTKEKSRYGNHQAFCLETQTFPGATDMPWVKSPVYKAGQEYNSTTIYKFSVLDK